MDKVDANVFLNSDLDSPIIDVRSPAEFQNGHLTGAVSIPLFTDEERKVIGTLYKKEGQKAAIKEGLRIAGPKMSGFIEEAEKLDSPQLRVHCWRGGMRSESMAWLFERYGFETTILTGGYKAYRNAMLSFFEQPLSLKVITGFTGCQKTALLHEMSNHGAQIIDLEGLACHQGSSFGNAKTCGQPTTEQFQNDLFEYCRQLDVTEPIWIEDESICIGNVSLPESLFRQMNRAAHVRINASMEDRLNFLVSDYGQLEKEKLKVATLAISKRLGSKQTSSAVESIEQGDMENAARAILGYYDRQYEKSISKKSKLIEAEFNLENGQVEELAKQILNH